MGGSHVGELSFVLVNPKDVNGSSRSYLQVNFVPEVCSISHSFSDATEDEEFIYVNWFLQEVLEMYSTELPTMKYAANTGKHSTFLERCVMNG